MYININMILKNHNFDDKKMFLKCPKRLLVNHVPLCSFIQKIKIKIIQIVSYFNHK